jgi:hypothetical protein
VPYRIDENPLAIDGQNDGHVMQRFVSEFVKSYGAKYDDEKNEWSWDVANIGEAFRESPVWTSIDYLTLGVPVGKLGLAARAVAKGASAPGRALQAARAGERIAALETGSTRIGSRIAARLMGGDDLTARAIELQRRAPATSRLGRILESPVAGLRRGADDDYLELIKRGYGSEADRHAYAQMYQRERLATIEADKMQAADVAGSLRGLSADSGAKVTQALEVGGVRPAGAPLTGWGGGHKATRRMAGAAERAPLGERATRMQASLARQEAIQQKRLGKLLGGDEKALAAYQKTWSFREAVHRRAYDLGLISRDTYARGLGKYAPHLYEEFLAAEELAGASRVKPGGTLDSLRARTLDRQEEQLSRRASKLRNRAEQLRQFAAEDPTARKASARRAEALDRQAAKLLGRKEHLRDDYTRILDPQATAGRLLGTAQAVAKQEFAQKLAKSVVATDDAWGVMERYGKDMPGVQRLMAKRAAGQRVSREAIDDVMFSELGWRRMEQLFPNGKVPGYLERLRPTGLLDKYLDPAAAESIVGTYKFADKPIFEELHDAIYKSVAFFRSSKTVMNPSTHARNTMSGIVFNSLATGIPKLVPRTGIKELRAKGEVWKAAVRAGVLGGDDHQITIEMLQRAGVDINDLNPYKLKFLGDNRIAKAIANSHEAAKGLYRFEDDMWKLDAFATLRKKYLKRGLRADQADARAALDVVKFMPSFNQVSPFTRAIGGLIPFASFTNEAIRIWKNAMIEKPHLAMFWSHFGGAASQSIAAAQGYSSDDLARIDANLPNHQQGKPRLMLPFKVDGQPHFFDLSYIIPLAGNMGDIEHADKAFFFSDFYDITGNPLIGAGVVGATGVDPFTGREVEPRFMERQLGMNIDNPALRRYIGLGEWMAATMLPPLAPPGFAAQNLAEVARGQKDPTTGLELEPNVGRTIAANLFGMRTYEATLSSNILNQRQEADQINKRAEIQWNIWKRAAANGETAAQSEAVENLRDIYAKLYDDPAKIEERIADGMESRAPGEFKTLTEKQLLKALEGTEGLELSPEQLKVRGAIMARLQTKGSRSRSRKGRGRGKRSRGRE